MYKGIVFRTCLTYPKLGEAWIFKPKYWVLYISIGIKISHLILHDLINHEHLTIRQVFIHYWCFHIYIHPLRQQ